MNRRDVMLLSPALMLAACKNKETGQPQELEKAGLAPLNPVALSLEQRADQCFAIYILLRAIHARKAGEPADANPHVDNLKKYAYKDLPNTSEFYPNTTSVSARYGKVYDTLHDKLQDPGAEVVVRRALADVTQALQYWVAAALGIAQSPYPGGDPNNCFDKETADIVANLGLLHPPGV